MATPPAPVAALLPRLGEAAAEIIRTCVTEVPEYQRLPATVLNEDLVANAEALVRLTLTAMAEGRTLTDEELVLPVSWGAERARDGLPLDAVLRIYLIGAREAWRLAGEATDTMPEPRELLEVFGRTLDFLDSVMPKVAVAYLRERQDLDWAHREDRQHLAAALLAGRPAGRLAERLGYALAERFTVVVYQQPDPGGQHNRLEATARFRATQAAIDRVADVLASVDRDRGILLIPATAASPTDRVAELLATIDGAAGTSTLAGAAAAQNLAGIPRAVKVAGEVLTLAERLHRDAGQFWLSDLALEFQLAHPGPARDWLAQLIAPVVDKPHLLAALRAFVRTGHNRARAASMLNVHRNTLNYRLGRIQLSTGLDPTRPADAAKLAAALVAHDLSTEDGDEPA